MIRQRAKAVPSDRRPGHQPTASTQPASIEPDGVESFARDLRALRVQADLDYPELAERSHFTMKTLASAAGGLRLPTLPVAVAYVRACGGNVTEWEERWQKLAAKEAADAARGGAVGEPQDPAAIAQDRDRDPGEVYVITSAKPRRPGW